MSRLAITIATAFRTPNITRHNVTILPGHANPGRTTFSERTPGEYGVDTRVEPFEGYDRCAADILLAADDAALSDLRSATDGRLFDALRAGIRSGRIICYTLRRRCVLEQLGFEELLDALGFAFMGACR
ncbi:MAG: hypothetical protein P8Y53_08345 [Pseudolabrys sp.]